LKTAVVISVNSTDSWILDAVGKELVFCLKRRALLTWPTVSLPFLPTKSCVIDPISTSLLKKVSDYLTPAVTSIANLSLYSGVFPH
jgi:hypothetical protein